jgi:hypothetical protein
MWEVRVECDSSSPDGVRWFGRVVYRLTGHLLYQGEAKRTADAARRDAESWAVGHMFPLATAKPKRKAKHG